MPWPSLGEVVVIEKDSAGNLMQGHSPLMRNTYNTLAPVAGKRHGYAASRRQLAPGPPPPCR